MAYFPPPPDDGDDGDDDDDDEAGGSDTYRSLIREVRISLVDERVLPIVPYVLTALGRELCELLVVCVAGGGLEALGVG